jgi:nitroreductase
MAEAGDRRRPAMELYEVMRTTSAVRHFTGDPLPDEVLHRILENARFAPSGGNRQGTQVVVVRAQATREALVELTLPAARRYVAQRHAGENPWNTVEPSRVTDEQVAETDVPEDFTRPLLEAAVVLVVCVDLRLVAALDRDLDRVGLVGGASVYPLVWNILLAARNEGFGGTITTMAVAEEPRVRGLLGIPEAYAVACVVPLGKPVHQPSRLSRVDVSELTRREGWNGGPL